MTTIPFGTPGKSACNGEPSEPALVDIEKFIHEFNSENMTSAPLTVKRGKIYDTNNLLDILEDKSSRSKPQHKTKDSPQKTKDLQHTTKTNTKTKQSPLEVTSVRRKAENQHPEEHHKKAKSDVKKTSDVKNKPQASSPLKEDIETTNKTKTGALPKRSRQSKLTRDDVRKTGRASKLSKDNDKVNNIYDNKTLVPVLTRNRPPKKIEYGKIEEIPEINFEFARMSIEPIIIRKAKLVIHSPLHSAEVVTHDIRMDISNPVIDLTSLDKDSLKTVSERECALKILPIVHKFYNITQVNEKVMKALDEVRGCLSQEDRKEDYFLNLERITQKAKGIGSNLVAVLSEMHVRNFNIVTFLSFLVKKLNQNYKSRVDVNAVALYLKQLLLDQNTENSNSEFLQKFSTEVNDFVNVKYENEESINDWAATETYFLEEQISQLKLQIETYNKLFPFTAASSTGCVQDRLELYDRNVKEERLNEVMAQQVGT